MFWMAACILWVTSVKDKQRHKNTIAEMVRGGGVLSCLWRSCCQAMLLKLLCVTPGYPVSAPTSPTDGELGCVLLLSAVSFSISGVILTETETDWTVSMRLFFFLHANSVVMDIWTYEENWGAHIAQIPHGKLNLDSFLLVSHCAVWSNRSKKLDATNI